MKYFFSHLIIKSHFLIAFIVSCEMPAQTQVLKQKKLSSYSTKIKNNYSKEFLEYDQHNMFKGIKLGEDYLQIKDLLNLESSFTGGQVKFFDIKNQSFLSYGNIQFETGSADFLNSKLVDIQLSYRNEKKLRETPEVFKTILSNYLNATFGKPEKDNYFEKSSKTSRTTWNGKNMSVIIIYYAEAQQVTLMILSNKISKNPIRNM